jgi:cell division protein FtsQ
MTRKTETLTTRQRQSQQIMRDKAAKKRRDGLKRKCQFIFGAILGVVVVGGGGTFWYSGAMERTFNTMAAGVFNTTAKAGFTVQSLHIEGRNRTPMAVVVEALGVRKNAPILQLSLAEMRDKLKAVHSIRDAAVERTLPGSLYVRIVEREPAALWQFKGKIALVDDEGVVMQGIDIAPYVKLPLIVGDGAPTHVQELMQILKQSPDIAKEFASAIWVGDRRWNIRLKGDIELKLPEQGAGEALVRLARVNQEQQLLERSVSVIDLRLADRLFIKVAPSEPAVSDVGAKEI